MTLFCVFGAAYGVLMHKPDFILFALVACVGYAALVIHACHTIEEEENKSEPQPKIIQEFVRTLLQLEQLSANLKSATIFCDHDERLRTFQAVVNTQTSALHIIGIARQLILSLPSVKQQV